MSKFRFLSLILIALAALLVLFDSAHWFRPEAFYSLPFRLGLDLQGGAHLVYEAETARVSSGERAEAMEGLRDVIERRVNLFGVAEPLVQVQRSGTLSGASRDRLIVELPGVTDISRAISEIGETPLLEFRVPGPNIPRDLESASTEAEEVTFLPSGLDGRYLKRAAVNFDQTTGRPLVSLEFDEEGQRLFAEITRANVGQPLAIYLDGRPISLPVVQEEIPSGRAQITGEFSREEVTTLVRRLNSGALPVPITLVSQETVGATLGDTVLARGIYAGVIGLVAVVLFLLVWYRLPGLIAALALILYITLMLALFKIIPITLTAAGLAGFVLSVGMAVDANILIFERMKEERRRGKDQLLAIQDGFARAWLSIRDSNVSSLITAFILFWMGTGVVRGFALVLGVGVLISMFSAITVSRSFLLALPLFHGGRVTRFLMGAGAD